MITVYVASKIHFADKLRDLREEWCKDGIFINSRWLDQAQYEDSNGPEEFKICWLVDAEDVQRSNALIVYNEVSDPLRSHVMHPLCGALIETGMAIAQNKLVFATGLWQQFGTWVHHPLVVKSPTLAHTRHLLLQRFR